MIARMETIEISEHQVKLFNFLVSCKGWCTAVEAAESTKVAKRTARAHLIKFVRAGIVDQAELWPGHRYRLSGLAEKRNKALIQRLKQASEILTSVGNP